MTEPGAEIDAQITAINRHIEDLADDLAALRADLDAHRAAVWHHTGPSPNPDIPTPDTQPWPAGRRVLYGRQNEKDYTAFAAAGFDTIIGVSGNQLRRAHDAGMSMWFELAPFIDTRHSPTWGGTTHATAIAAMRYWIAALIETGHSDLVDGVWWDCEQDGVVLNRQQAIMDALRDGWLADRPICQLASLRNFDTWDAAVDALAAYVWPTDPNNSEQPDMLTNRQARHGNAYTAVVQVYRDTVRAHIDSQLANARRQGARSWVFWIAPDATPDWSMIRDLLIEHTGL